MTALLREHGWLPYYSRSGPDLVREFWIPALAASVRYDRTTGYFTAPALTLAARGLEGLVRNRGRMRLVVGCTLGAEEIEAIRRGHDLADVAGAVLGANPLAAERPEEVDALGLLAWMVARGHLEVRVAVPCNARRQPVAGGEIFHAKSGLFEDKVGDRIAFSGSINETREGWLANWEEFHVFTSWSESVPHLLATEQAFERLWQDRDSRARVIDVPTAAAQRLLDYLPGGGALPRRLREKQEEKVVEPVVQPGCAEGAVAFEGQKEQRARVWAYIARAPALPGGEWVGEATSAVTAWPHQAHAYLRMWRRWPPRLLIADEVGLGKTIQAGLLLRQAWLTGRAGRMLVVAPSAVLRQWQIELREKFNLNWPIYDGRKLRWYPTPAFHGCEREVAPDAWHREPLLLVSSHLVRRRERARELIEHAEPWDLVVVDEAHHARRRGADPDRNEPNRLLGLLRRLKPKMRGLLLLTATPMQLHPIEVWDLLDLLGLPPEWSATNFLKFFELVGRPEVGHEELAFLARLFRAVEAWDGATPQQLVEKILDRRDIAISALTRRRLLDRLRDRAETPRRMLQGEARRAALAVIAASSPIARRVSRNTRGLLRHYRRLGRLQDNIAEREVRDLWVPMRPEEGGLYEAVERYVSEAWRRASDQERRAVGFAMTIYRRRLASSVRALQRTLEGGIARIRDEEAELLEEDLAQEIDPEELEAGLESTAIRDLLAACATIGTESKAETLLGLLRELRDAGYGHILVFTQYTDTMDFLRELLHQRSELRIARWSGRGGEIDGAGETSRSCGRDELKQRFANGEIDVLLCTDAAAEGLNFQFAGALVNYDMPWNPMRVEQRIGRIDRIDQRYDRIRIVNLHVAGTVEADVYRALRDRIRLFEGVVGPLQPILARLPRRIEQATAAPERAAVSDLAEELVRDIASLEASGLDLDLLAEGGVLERPRAEPPLSLDHLRRLLDRTDLLPAGVEVVPVGLRDRVWRDSAHPDGVRVTADAGFFELHAESCELFSPGSPIFPEAGHADAAPDRATFERLLGHPRS